jgi:quercetin dioxygenase-like cupin family protein
MKTWDLQTLDVQPHQPEVLDSDDEGRVIAIHLPGGEALGEHRVHERAFLVVVSGQVEVQDAQGETVSGGAGLMAVFEPNEDHEVRAIEDARLILVLSPWPGPGHPNLRNQGEAEA